MLILVEESQDLIVKLFTYAFSKPIKVIAKANNFCLIFLFTLGQKVMAVKSPKIVS
jgi:hypothetical protein